MLISPDSFVLMPWKNGLGQTLELQKDSLPGEERFAWRLSIAAVTEDGEFSHFVGYDRTLVLLEGQGITLTIASGEEHRLICPLQIARFKGDDNTFASLHNGPISDFNIMTSRDHCRAEVIGHEDTSPFELTINCGLLFVYSVQGNLSIKSIDESLLVPEHHLLKLEKPHHQTLGLEGATFIAIQIFFNN